MRKVSVLSYRMTTADSNNPQGIVPIGRQFDFWGDAETELMILNDGDESLCLGYNDVSFKEDIFVGEQLDFKATLIKVGNTSRTCRVQTFKVASPAKRIGIEGAKDTDMFYYDKPKLVGEGTVVLVVKKELQRGQQPDGIIVDPWKDID
ncbi:beta-alanyl-CoA:ammonia lyase [Clostridium botulinum]|uniref:Beta-alanyl-CoA:ammonia lyase n=1 Tax=Clostridium botulinum C/D str. DC5 TaxID=1443128 RepID=A0A0A0IJ86_CLOBO|nr:hotdog fold domain-containing protein [Clostridium botulinum]KEI00477.1 beta-alanyl-CoA:ammonia lyase [Clostridium botulinum C/D str. BKT75002]KEI07307.1 beta-alanyl-CoA:ammonia lyase [Clostridium botulinum C/D str. BKT2873]KGM96309.1 beta-alanyl-CoA:ammonia lyase [Clostridium botulinum D str. CCUG 7971]KGN01033.1 beta-alanyl-CoA:ammonia lyase [Clostridium botulinum C/D str. DC5]KOC49455.1 beta-alanyl-CoA:ammonia lyase [Clostridium botulinum]